MKKLIAIIVALALLVLLILPVGSADDTVHNSNHNLKRSPDSAVSSDSTQIDVAEPVPGTNPEQTPEQNDPDVPDVPDESETSRFSDVLPDKFYTESVEWAVDTGITAGTTPTTFSPNDPCTRAQAVTFLWRAAGMPEPKSTINPFADVPDGQFYTTAVLWAVQNGVTTGTSANRFSPKATCSRAQIVTFLHRAAGTPSANGGSFDDVPKDSYYELPVCWAVEKDVTNGISATRFGPNKPCTRAQIVTFLYRAKDIRINPKPQPFTQNFALYYADSPLPGRLECDTNRPYISMDLLKEWFDLDPVPAAKQLSWPLRYGTDGEYIALSDAVKLCRIGVQFQEEDHSVHLYRLANYNWVPAAAGSGNGKAYLRLEDIMADYGINGRFTHNNLNMLRFYGAYLRDHTDAFYIAWIPLYVNPGENIRNDISRDESFYNVDFVFTLDCLVDDGGKIGLHGLTHQHADEVSASGYEFGDNIPYTKEELLDVFRQAEDICSRMGYSYSFFEFPHYAASDFQRQVAEAHFNIIYQQYPGSSNPGHIEVRKTGKHVCLWVPTPAECVHSRYDSDGIVDRLTQAHDAGKEVSLYFHPVMDDRSWNVKIRDDVMTFTYNEETGILPRIIRLTDSWGYRFCSIK